jgi:hypothetical protein
LKSLGQFEGLKSLGQFEGLKIWYNFGVFLDQLGEACLVDPIGCETRQYL